MSRKFLMAFAATALLVGLTSAVEAQYCPPPQQCCVVVCYPQCCPTPCPQQCPQAQPCPSCQTQTQETYYRNERTWQPVTRMEPRDNLVPYAQKKCNAYGCWIEWVNDSRGNPQGFYERTYGDNGRSYRGDYWELSQGSIPRTAKLPNKIELASNPRSTGKRTSIKWVSAGNEALFTRR